MTKAKRGIYAAAISPFQADGTLDAAKLTSYCRHLLTDGGCDGVAPMGTTGEGTSIALQDRLALPQAFQAAGFQSEQVIFGTGAPAIGDSIALTRAAVDAGFCNVLVLPPYFYKNVSDDGLFAAYARLIEQVGREDLRVYLYHFPQMSQTPISPELVVRLRQAFGPIIAGLKDSSGDFEQSRAIISATGGIAEDFDIYPSSETMLWQGLSIGTAGIISGSTNAFGTLAQAALRATQGTERDAAMAAVQAGRAVASKYPLMAAMKQIEAWRSGDDSWTRMAPPLTNLSPDQAAELRADLDQLNQV
ncbi:dihydrodipicolinate synthase family protein [Pseudophaeobacter sp.]|uniref:dihydrodipicolinate synthase family protein n=1 Tax=Pseudophaeobacter sp. TaxID=1971739 RepID=UPI00405A1937